MDDLELIDDGVADALDFLQPRAGRGHHLGERAEPGDQFLGQLFDVALRDGAEQDQFEQFIIADGVLAGLAETVAQPLAVPVIMGRGLGKAVRSLE